MLYVVIITSIDTFSTTRSYWRLFWLNYALYSFFHFRAYRHFEFWRHGLCLEILTKLRQMNQPDRCFDTQFHDVLPQRKKKKLNMQNISFMYKEFLLALLCFLDWKSKTLSKMQNGYVACLCQLTRNFTWLPAVTYTRKWRNMERLQVFLSQQRKDARNQDLAKK
jgi:hypothetical protein